MKHVRLILIQGLILLSALSAFSEDDPEPAAASAPAPQAAEAPQASGGGLTKIAEEILDTVRWIEEDLTSGGAKSEAKKVGEQRVKLQTYKDEYQGKCSSREKTTEYICREKSNPALVEALPLVQGIVTAVSGTQDACSKFGKATALLNKALLVYQATCSGAKLLCQNSCEKSKTILEQAKATVLSNISSGITEIEKMNPSNKEVIKKALEHGRSALTTAIDRELSATADSIASNLKTCTGFDKQLASAAVGIVGVVKSLGDANKCAAQTAATTPTPAPPYTLPGKADCSVDVNKTLFECICPLAPNTKGCPNATTPSSPTASSGLSPSDIAALSTKSGVAPVIPTGGAPELPPVGKGDGSGTGTPGAPISGGSAMDGGSGAGGGPTPGAQRSGSRLNANVLGSEGGGGGGGGGWGGGSEGGAGGGDPALRKYLPGGANDPTGLAGKAAVAKQVTSEGGKSNWEKVRERYRDNKPTLLGY